MVHTPTPIPEHGDVTVLWNKRVHTEIQKLWQIGHIKQLETKKRGSMRTDRCGKTGGQKYHVKGSGKDIKIQKSTY
jgi:hypothetical protein